MRVLVVDDSVTARKHLVEVLNGDPECEVAGEAEDGKKAIELCRTLRPDVMTLDMMLPIMSGVAVTEYVMAYCPTPILVVSSSLNRGELYKTYDALAAGAVDVFEKPSGQEPDGAWERGFLASVKTASKIPVITHIRGKFGGGSGMSGARGCQACGELAQKSIVAIGASTGGPAAVAEILRALPVNFPMPVLLVIHIGDPFSAAFAEWLDGLSPFRVRYAIDEEALPSYGTSGMIMAPPGFHLVVRHKRLRLTRDPERHSCRPSVDVLFESLARECGRETVACLLTGMGKDGASGLLQLRHTGALTIAQDQASSVVFGMPGAAIQMGSAERVLSLNEIAPVLTHIGRQARKEAWRRV